MADNKKVVKENKPKGHGPGGGTFGTKKSVANQVPKSWWKSTAKKSPNKK